MSIKVEVTPSNRSHCAKCKHIIPIGTKRLVESQMSGMFTQKTYFCKICGIKALIKDKEEIDECIGELKNE